MVALFLFLKGMTGALAPFSYLVKHICSPQSRTNQRWDHFVWFPHK